MNHRIWTAAGARVIALSFVIAGLAACGDRLSDTRTSKAPENPPSSSAVVIGQAPAEPQGDTPQTTPSSASQSQLSKQDESTKMPREGDNHSYSTLAPDSPQKAENADAQQLPGRSATQ